MVSGLYSDLHVGSTASWLNTTWLLRRVYVAVRKYGISVGLYDYHVYCLAQTTIYDVNFSNLVELELISHCHCTSRTEFIA